MNGMSEKKERDERNDQAYARWVLLQGEITHVRLIGKPRVIHHNLSGAAMVQTTTGPRYRVAFCGVSWEALAAFAYAPSSSKALATARTVIRVMLRSGEGLEQITEMRATTPSREKSLATIRRMLRRDKPGYLLGLPIR